MHYLHQIRNTVSSTIRFVVSFCWRSPDIFYISAISVGCLQFMLETESEESGVFFWMMMCASNQRSKECALHRVNSHCLHCLFITVHVLSPGEDATLNLQLLKPMVCEKGQRFTLRDGKLTLGTGVITKILPDVTEDGDKWCRDWSWRIQCGSCSHHVTPNLIFVWRKSLSSSILLSRYFWYGNSLKICLPFCIWVSLKNKKLICMQVMSVIVVSPGIVYFCM